LILRLFGFNITKANPVPQSVPAMWDWRSNWFGIIRESFTGAWQRNVEVRLDNVLTFSAVYSCISLIASDIGKLHLRIVEQDKNGIWTEREVAAFSPVLRKPNRYQTRQKFVENWITSKLIHGNTYVLKERDSRNVVVKLYILDPQYTKPMIAPDGEVFYQLNTSYLAGVESFPLTPSDINPLPSDNRATTVTVPASEIIHDVMVPLYHPLCGVSPITACGLAAVQGLNIQTQSAKFFANNSNPGGVLTAPGTIDDATAKRLKDYWDLNYTGSNAGKVAVLGDGLSYEPMTVNATDSKLIEQLKWSAETVCSTFHVPPYMIGVGPMPTYNNVEALNQQYYQQCLQCLIEAIEALLDEGLALSSANQVYGTEFDLDDLLRMDTATQYRTYGEGVSKGILGINEARKKINLPPVKGGGNYLQQQNYSLEALNKRDSKDDPFAPAKLPTPPPQAKPNGGSPPQVAPPPPQKLLPNYSKLSPEEMFELLGSAL
jgi:HK97 family phage portal protein